MNKIVFLYLVIFSAVAVQWATAQTTLTLEECRAQALEYNKELKKAGLKITEAEKNKKATATAHLPAISASVSASHSFRGLDINIPGGFLPTADSEQAAAIGNFSGVSNVYSPGMNLSTDNITYAMGGLSLQQPIYMGGQIRNLNKQAESAVAMAQSGYNLKGSEVIELTDQSFWNVAMIEANIDLAQKYIDMLTELEEQMTDMYAAGLTPASEKLKVSVQKNEAQLQLLVANNGLKIAKMYLNQVIGRDLKTPVEITYDSTYTEHYDMSTGVNTAIQNREELKLTQKQIELQQFQKNIDMANYKPSLGLSAQYSNIYVNELAEDVNFQPLIGAQLSIPLFKWGQGKQKRDAADMRIEQAEMELSNVTDLISLEVMQTKVRVEEAYEAILIAKRNINQAEESLEETKASFSVGLNTTTDLLNSQADWQNAQSNLITAIAEYKIRITAWERVTGMLSYKIAHNEPIE